MIRSSQQSLAEGESESSDDESEAEMKFIRKTVKSRGIIFCAWCIVTYRSVEI